MLKNRVSALLAQHRLEKPEVSDLYGKCGMAWLKTLDLPTPDDYLLKEDSSLIEFLAEKIKSTDGLIKELGAGDEV